MKCLIVGQGIAGTVLAWTLMQRGVAVQIADAGFPHQSSGAAAGIINPVTGKRFVKSWRFDTFFPAARATYQAMETELHCAIWQELPILRVLENAQQANDWAARMAVPEYAAVLGERPDAGPWSSFLSPGLQTGEIRQAARVDFPQLLSTFRQKAAAEGLLQTHQMTPVAAKTLAADFDYIIFCEGHRGLDNPFFPNLPWQLSKGDGLLFRFEEPAADGLQEMVKRNLMLAPLGDGLFWAGATYQWTFRDDGTSEPEQISIEERLSGMLSAPYRVVKRFGAIRPTVKDRRPFIGISPLHPKMIIFNGLGTKGALLAPYWAGHLADCLLSGKEIDAEVNIARFAPVSG